MWEKIYEIVLDPNFDVSSVCRVHNFIVPHSRIKLNENNQNREL